ncbi:hypothetical protein PENSPDRAFT_271828 [Peniophora sp. CONT]|nr:hypothetical protein PENSPDRAFT_271828 [Peniophora sp. CONT]
MELYSSHSDPRNTDLTDNRGFIVYRISTNSSFASSGTSTISRFVPGPGGQPQPIVIAQIEWHSFSPTIFRFRGAALKEKQYIPGHGIISRQRTFTAGSGRSYTWSTNVLNLTGGHEVARWHNKSGGVFSGRAHPAYVQIAGDAVQDLDEIIQTLVYVQGKARDDNDAGTYGAIGAGGAIAAS